MTVAHHVLLVTVVMIVAHHVLLVTVVMIVAHHVLLVAVVHQVILATHVATKINVVAKLKDPHGKTGSKLSRMMDSRTGPVLILETSGATSFNF
jgi:hypothetical protein